MEAEEKKELKTAKFSDKSRSKAAAATPPNEMRVSLFSGMGEGGFTISITGNLFAEYRKLSNSGRAD